MILVAIDPGASAGWARFINGTLSSCGLGVPPIVGPGIATATDVVVEKPEYHKHEKVNPNDLITLAIRVGRDVERAAREGISARIVRPTEWKGSVPKTIHHPRIRAVLDGTETDILDRALGANAKSKGHNVVDAVGLGLWHVGRLAR